MKGLIDHCHAALLYGKPVTFLPLAQTSPVVGLLKSSHQSHQGGFSTQCGAKQNIKTTGLQS